MLSYPGEWSSLKVTGQAPLPCSLFTLTTVGENMAAMYGGQDGSKTFNDLFIVELGRHSVVSVITCWCHCLIIVGGVVYTDFMWPSSSYGVVSCIWACG